jgi:hypothetical protein
VPYIQEQLGHESIRMTVDLNGKSVRRSPQPGGVAAHLENGPGSRFG